MLSCVKSNLVQKDVLSRIVLAFLVVFFIFSFYHSFRGVGYSMQQLNLPSKQRVLESRTNPPPKESKALQTLGVHVQEFYRHALNRFRKDETRLHESFYPFFTISLVVRSLCFILLLFFFFTNHATSNRLSGLNVLACKNPSRFRFFFSIT